MTPYVLATDDLGATWRPLATRTSRATPTSSGRIRSIPDLLYLGTENGLY